MFRKKFKNIGVIARDITKEDIIESIKVLYEHLNKSNLNVYTDNNCSNILNHTPSDYDVIGSSCDLAIVVGGDGSILYAAHQLSKYNIPIVGINRGKLGFLTDLPAQNFTEILDEILKGAYTETTLFSLKGEIINSDNDENSKKHSSATQSCFAINDIVLNAGNITRMIDFELYIDNQFVCSQRSDGLIIATPTGSTAYSLSAGGPILMPDLDAITLVPMFPHNLNSRPIVVPASSEITIKITSELTSTNNEYNLNPGISSDGGKLLYLKQNDTFKISMSNNKLRLIHPKNYSYFETLRTKLYWNRKLTK